MVQITKKVERFLSNPSSCRLKEIEAILIYYGFEKINAKGSHVKFKHVLLTHDIVIPIHNNDCKDFYKQQIAVIIKKIKNETQK